MGSNWSQLCTEAIEVAGATRLKSTAAFAVMITLWSVALIVGSVTCYLWLRAGDLRRHAWNLYGWLALFVTLASITGIIHSVTYMKYNDFILESEQVGVDARSRPDVTRVARRMRQAELISQAFQWNSVSDVFYGFKVLLMFSAKMLILDRLIFFAYLAGNPGLTDNFRARVMTAQRSFFGFVALCNVVGIVLHCVAAEYSQQSVPLFQKSVQAYSLGDGPTGDALFTQGYERDEIRYRFIAGSSIAEGLALACIVVVFLVVGGKCIHRVRTHTKSTRMTSDAAELQLKMYGTISVVFVTFLLRACFNFFLIAVLANVGFADNCAFKVGCNRCNSECQCFWRPIFSWLDFTPQLEVAVETVSGPVALLVALWGMTSARTRQALIPSILESRPSGSEGT